jgi:hypothetical protein
MTPGNHEPNGSGSTPDVTITHGVTIVSGVNPQQGVPVSRA